MSIDVDKFYIVTWTYFAIDFFLSIYMDHMINYKHLSVSSVFT